MCFISPHPGRTKDNAATSNSFKAKRSVIQLAELEWKDGEIICDRDKEVIIRSNFASCIYSEAE